MIDNIVKGKFPKNGRRQRHIDRQRKALEADLNASGDGDFEYTVDYIPPEPEHARGPALSRKQQFIDNNIVPLLGALIVGSIAAMGVVAVTKSPELVGGGDAAWLVKHFLLLVAYSQVAVIGYRNWIVASMIFATGYVMWTYTSFLNELSDPAITYIQIGFIAIALGFGLRALGIGRRSHTQ